MSEPLLFGLAASSALVIGGVAGAYWRPRRLVAVALAFASGALITAFTFDMFEESFKAGGAWLSGIGLLAGAATFVVTDELLDRYIEGAGGGVSGFAILAAVTLDGGPENLAPRRLPAAGRRRDHAARAIFASNLPESLGGAVGMRDQGRSRTFVISVWSLTALLLAASVVAGNAALASVGERPLAVLRLRRWRGPGLARRHADARRLPRGRRTGRLRHRGGLLPLVHGREDLETRVRRDVLG